MHDVSACLNQQK